MRHVACWIFILFDHTSQRFEDESDGTHHRAKEALPLYWKFLQECFGFGGRGTSGGRCRAKYFPRRLSVDEWNSHSFRYPDRTSYPTRSTPPYLCPPCSGTLGSGLRLRSQVQ